MGLFQTRETHGYFRPFIGVSYPVTPPQCHPPPKNKALLGENGGLLMPQYGLISSGVAAKGVHFQVLQP